MTTHSSQMLATFALLAVTLFALQPAAARADERTKFAVGEQARTIKAHLDGGYGWSVVARRENVTLIGNPNGAEDCVTYRPVTSYRYGADANGQEVIEMALGTESNWIVVALGTPTADGSMLDAINAASQAINQLNVSIAQLERSIQAENDPQARATADLFLRLMHNQHEALTYLVQQQKAALSMMR